MSQQKLKVRCCKCNTLLEQGTTECTYCHSQLCPSGHPHQCLNAANCMHPDVHVCPIDSQVWTKVLPSYRPPQEQPPPEPEYKEPWLPTAMYASGPIDTIDEGGR